MNHRGTLPIEEIRERDIDLLLLEEISVNETFRRFLTRKLGLKKIKTFFGAYHSLTQGGRGESDLVISYEDENGRTLLILIENKIDAVFADRQSERYRERGTVYQLEKDCSYFVTVLIAPSSYIKNGHGFDLSVTYEDIKAWFQQQKDARSMYKAGVIDAAIERKRRGYQPIKNDQVTSFQHQFYLLSESMYSELSFRKPVESAPKGSGFMYCEPLNLKKHKIQIVHKFFAKENFNAVDLQFIGRASDYAEFNKRFKDKLEGGMEVVVVNKSLAVRFKLPRMETSSSFKEQKQTLLLSIEYAKRLYTWALANLEI